MTNTRTVLLYSSQEAREEVCCNNVTDIGEARKRRLTSAGRALLEHMELASFLSSYGPTPPSDELLQLMLDLPPPDRIELAEILGAWLWRWGSGGGSVRTSIGRLATSRKGEPGTAMARVGRYPRRCPPCSGGHRGVLAQEAQLRFLLFPYLASVAYLLFTRPVGAAIGSLGALAFGPGFFAVLVVAFATMLAMRLLRVTTPPVLAVATLPLAFGARGFEYPASIFLGTSVLFLLFKGWQSVLPGPGARRD